MYRVDYFKNNEWHHSMHKGKDKAEIVFEVLKKEYETRLVFEGKILAHEGPTERRKENEST